MQFMSSFSYPVLIEVLHTFLFLFFLRIHRESSVAFYFQLVRCTPTASHIRLFSSIACPSLSRHTSPCPRNHVRNSKTDERTFPKPYTNREYTPYGLHLLACYRHEGFREFRNGRRTKCQDPLAWHGMVSYCSTYGRTDGRTTFPLSGLCGVLWVNMGSSCTLSWAVKI